MNNKKAQQEIVGFVLIVVLVIVGLMVFLIISLRPSGDITNSGEVDSILSSIMRHTTDCAISYEPDYDNFQDLFKSCYKNKECSNLNIPACDYLNDTLRSVLGDMMKSEASISAYELTFSEKQGAGLLRISDGNCTGKTSGAQRVIVSGSESLIVNMKICKTIK